MEIGKEEEESEGRKNNEGEERVVLWRGDICRFRAVEMEELADTFGVVFDLFGDHEIHEAAFSIGDDEDLVFLRSSVVVVLVFRRRWGDSDDDPSLSQELLPSSSE